MGTEATAQQAVDELLAMSGLKDAPDGYAVRAQVRTVCGLLLVHLADSIYAQVAPIPQVLAHLSTLLHRPLSDFMTDDEPLWLVDQSLADLGMTTDWIPVCATVAFRLQEGEVECCLTDEALGVSVDNERVTPYSDELLVQLGKRAGIFLNPVLPLPNWNLLSTGQALCVVEHIDQCWEHPPQPTKPLDT